MYGLRNMIFLIYNNLLYQESRLVELRFPVFMQKIINMVRSKTITDSLIIFINYIPFVLDAIKS